MHFGQTLLNNGIKLVLQSLRALNPVAAESDVIFCRTSGNSDI